MADLSRDIVSIYTSKITALAKEMEASNYGRGEGGIVALLRAAAKDLDDQNLARGGATGASIVRPEALQAFAATMSPARHAFLFKQAPEKERITAAANDPFVSSDPLMRFLAGDPRGTSISAAADAQASVMTAAAKSEAERHLPAAEALLARGGAKSVFEKASSAHGQRLTSVAQAAMVMRVSATAVSCS